MGVKTLFLNTYDYTNLDYIETLWFSLIDKGFVAFPADTSSDLISCPRRYRTQGSDSLYIQLRLDTWSTIQIAQSWHGDFTVRLYRNPFHPWNYLKLLDLGRSETLSEFMYKLDKYIKDK